PLAPLERRDRAPQQVAIGRELDGRQRVERLEDDRAVAGAEPVVYEAVQRLAHRRAVGGVDVEFVEEDGNPPRLGLALFHGVDLLDDAVFLDLEVLGGEAGDRPALAIGDGGPDAYAARIGHGKRQKSSDEHEAILPEK